MKVGFVEINGDNCGKCLIKNACTKEGFCKCDEYWHNHPEDTRSETNECYIIEL